MWYTEAGKYNVFPIDGSAVQRLMTERPQVAEPRTQYVYRPGTQTMPFWVGPRVLNRPHSITADAEIPAGGAEGVLLCQGSNAGGWSFYVKDGRLRYAHNYVGRATYQVSAPDPLPAGRHQLRFEFEPTGKPDLAQGKGAPGRAQLYVDGQLIAQNEFPVTTPVAFNPGGLTCGANPGSADHHRLPGPVPLHRHAPHRHRRPVRRPHHRHRQRDAHGHGPPVNASKEAPSSAVVPDPAARAGLDQVGGSDEHRASDLFLGSGGARARTTCMGRLVDHMAPTGWCSGWSPRKSAVPCCGRERSRGRCCPPTCRFPRSPRKCSCHPTPSSRRHTRCYRKLGASSRNQAVTRSRDLASSTGDRRPGSGGGTAGRVTRGGPFASIVNRILIAFAPGNRCLPPDIFS